MLRKIVLIFFMLITYSTVPIIYADINDTVKGAEEQFETSKEKADTALLEIRKVQEENKIYLLTIISITTVVILFLVLGSLIWSKVNDRRSIFNASALVLVIQATLFSAIAASTHEQLTATIGVIAAIAGYLFGTLTAKKDDSEQNIRSNKPAM